MPPLPDGIFTVDTPGGGLHVPFVADDDDALMPNKTDVELGSSLIFEWKANNSPWCAPWQTRAEGGKYQPRDANAPLMNGGHKEYKELMRAWVRSHAPAEKPYAGGTKFGGFHPSWTDENFCERLDVTLLNAGMVDGSYHIVPEECPLCGRPNPRKSTIRAAKSKFMFGGKSFGFVCHVCGVNSRDDFEAAMLEADPEYVVFEDYEDEYIYADDDPKTLFDGFAEAVDDLAPEAPAPSAKYTYSPNDTGNGERLVRIYGKHIRYIWENGTWMVWCANGWQEDTNSKVLRMTKDVLQELFEEADDDKAKLSHLVKSSAISGRKAMMSSSAAEKCIITNLRDWDEDGWLYNVHNGVIELKTQTFRERTPKDMCLKQSQIDYDPLAGCPLFLPALDKWMCGDKELVEYLQVAVGVTLTSDTSLQAIFFNQGGGENGKDTFFNAIAHVLGTYRKNVGFETFVETKFGHSEHRNDLAALAGAVRMATAEESSDGHHLDEAIIKGVTGGNDSVITCREIRGKPFSYAPQYKPWFMSNYEPVIKGGDWGIWRRVKKIPWNYTLTPEEKDPHFGEKLKAEGSGILNWALEGLRKYIALGYRLPPCRAVDKATALYREEMDIFGKFAAEHFVFTPQATAFGNLIYKQYKAFCTDNGFRFQNSRRFYAEFRKRYPNIAEHPSKNGAVFEGVGLLVDGSYPTADLI